MSLPIYSTSLVRQLNPGALIEINVDNTGWVPIYNVPTPGALDWPITIIDDPSRPPQEYLQIVFTTDITLTQNNQYFICDTDYILFGKTSLNADGSRPTINISNVTNYPGFIQNGTNINPGNNYITVTNINVVSNGSTLAIRGGWIGQEYYSRAASNNWFINCSTNGDILEACGGIVGASAAKLNGNIRLLYCNSSGNIIGTTAGGIVGNNAGEGDPLNIGVSGGSVGIDQCSSSGTIIGSDAGGIIGANAGLYAGAFSGNCTVTNCYSSGNIQGLNAGGIVGKETQGRVNLNSCYSIGNIIGDQAGGIFGSLAGNIGPAARCFNCYSTGTISDNGGGIFGSGFNSPAIIAFNCYTSGTSVINTGGIFAGLNTDNTYGANNYSETNNGNSDGWKDSNANTYLTGAPIIGQPLGTNWVSLGTDTSYNLLNMGFTPYSINNIEFNSNIFSFTTTYSVTVAKGNGSIPSVLPSGYTYSPISINGDFYTAIYQITINPSTGQILTTAATPIGVYNIYLKNQINPYSITEIILTVEDAPPPPPPVPQVQPQVQPIPPCCQANVCSMNPQTTNYGSNVIGNRGAGAAVVSNVDNIYSGVANGVRRSMGQPIFKTYASYMLYLQGKHR